jgi:CRISPR/Cas system CMR-associated protein Cmr3 (group 5 of RAMP superfamily)
MLVSIRFAEIITHMEMTKRTSRVSITCTRNRINNERKALYLNNYASMIVY